MFELFILADDLTGALDTSVQFAAQGVSTLVVIDEAFDFGGHEGTESVLVMSIATRHVENSEAYRRVYDVSRRAVEAGIPYLFKKTDSILRGNVASELVAMMDASGAMRLDFLPAFPALGRTTVNGEQLLDGHPIHETVFGSDLLEPVTNSFIPDIISQVSDIRCNVIRSGESAQVLEEKHINIYDAETDEDLRRIVSGLYRENALRVMAGCAGLGSVLHDTLPLKDRIAPRDEPRGKLLVVCGTVNPITRKQLDYAQSHGFSRVTLSPDQKFSRSALSQDLIIHLMQLHKAETPVILDVAEDLRANCEANCTKEAAAKETRDVVAGNLGWLVRELWQRGVRATLMVTGGDTLLAVLEALNCREIHPIREIRPGVVLSECTSEGQRLPVISKSGGFGARTLLIDIAEEVERKNEETK